MSPHRREIPVFLALSFLLLSGLASGSVVHSVDIDGDSAQVTSVLHLTSEEEVNKWEMNLSMPNNTLIHSVKDSHGKVEYEMNGGKLHFRTNSGPRRSQESVRVNYTVNNVRNHTFKKLSRLEVSLFGLRGETTKAEVEAENIISWHTPFQFHSEKKNGTIMFEGRGALPLRFYTSQEGRQSEHYHYFSMNGTIRDAEEFFPIIPQITGIHSPQNRFPALFLEGERYDSLVNEWSSGRYKTGGLILMRRNMSRSRAVSTLIHETVHGFNEEILKWDETDTAYLNEGMAKFAEFLINQKANVPQAEVFGDKAYFLEEGKRYYLEPRSTPQELWDYYVKDENWMKGWNPWRGKAYRARRFGYAYAELMIRDFVRREDLESMREASRSLMNIDRKVGNVDEKKRMVEQRLGTFRPCYSLERKEFENCLEEVHGQSFNFTGLDANVTFSNSRSERINITARELGLVKRVEDEGGLLWRVKNLIFSLRRRMIWISRTLSRTI